MYRTYNVPTELRPFTVAALKALVHEFGNPPKYRFHDMAYLDHQLTMSSGLLGKERFTKSCEKVLEKAEELRLEKEGYKWVTSSVVVDGRIDVRVLVPPTATKDDIENAIKDASMSVDMANMEVIDMKPGYTTSDDGSIEIDF